MIDRDIGTNLLNRSFIDYTVIWMSLRVLSKDTIVRYQIYKQGFRMTGQSQNKKSPCFEKW